MRQSFLPHLRKLSRSQKALNMMKRLTAEHTVDIDLPIAECWQKMQDFSIAHHYVPGLIDSKVLTKQANGVGASRRVFKKMMALDETIIDWQEGKGFTIRLHDGDKDKPLPQSTFSYALAAKDENTTSFTGSMSYGFPLGSVGVLVSRYLILPFVKKEIRDVVLAVKYFYETGEKATPAILKRLRKGHEK